MPHSINISGIPDDDYSKMIETARSDGIFYKNSSPNVTEWARQLVYKALELVKKSEVRTLEDALKERRTIADDKSNKILVLKHLAFYLLKDSRTKGLDAKREIFEPEEEGQVDFLLSELRKFLRPRKYEFTEFLGDGKERQHNVEEKTLENYERYLRLGFEIQDRIKARQAVPSLS